MWEEYIREARTHVLSLGGDRALEVKYEDFLEEPAGVLEQMSEFSGLRVSGGQIKELTRSIDKDRAYRNEPELEALAEEMSDRLRAYGH